MGVARSQVKLALCFPVRCLQAELLPVFSGCLLVAFFPYFPLQRSPTCWFLPWLVILFSSWIAMEMIIAVDVVCLPSRMTASGRQGTYPSCARLLSSAPCSARKLYTFRRHVFSEWNGARLGNINWWGRRRAGHGRRVVRLQLLFEWREAGPRSKWKASERTLACDRMQNAYVSDTRQCHFQPGEGLIKWCDCHTVGCLGGLEVVEQK